jgi:hypothetical protein
MIGLAGGSRRGFRNTDQSRPSPTPAGGSSQSASVSSSGPLGRLTFSDSHWRMPEKERLFGATGALRPTSSRRLPAAAEFHSTLEPKLTSLERPSRLLCGLQKGHGFGTVVTQYANIIPKVPHHDGAGWCSASSSQPFDLIRHEYRRTTHHRSGLATVSADRAAGHLHMRRSSGLLPPNIHASSSASLNW